MKTQKVSFILPTRNVEKYIGPLLKSIYEQDYDGEIEVLIMDSSDDSTPEIVREFPVSFVRLEPEDYNYGKTRNEGAAMTNGEFLVFLSTDVEIRDKDWLSKLISHFADPEVAGVYGRQLPKESSPPMEQFFILNTYPAETSVAILKDGTFKERIVFFSNTNSAIRRSVWEQIRIPEMLKSEDQEWAKQALLAGCKIVYDAGAAVYHSHRYSLKGVFQEYFDTGAALPAINDARILDYSMGNFFIDGLKFVFNEYSFMIKNGYWYWLPYALIYDMMKFSGIFLGSKHRYMPLWMKRGLCKKKNHWDKYKGVIAEPACEE